MTGRLKALAIGCAAVVLIAAPTSAAAAKGKSKVTAQVYADNSFDLYVNGRFVVSDPITFTPFNVVKAKFKASYPMTIAIRAKDFADPLTGLEYDNTRTGDGGLIAKFSNGVVTGGSWRQFTTFIGPTNVQQCLATPSTCQVVNTPEAADWQSPGFNPSGWSPANVYTAAQVGPHDQYSSYNWKGASFIWGPDLVQDNTILFRKVVKKVPSRG